MNKLLYLLSFLLSFSTFGQNEMRFKQANALYNEGKYTDAINMYDAILATKKQSPELYFNLANAHYKLNNIAPSIYYYEKALQLAPKDADIKHNASFAKNMTVDAIDVIPESGLSKLLKKITNIFSFDAWAKISVGFVFLFVFLFLVYYFAYSTISKRLAFIGNITSIALMGIALLFAFQKFNLDKNDKPAIVFSKETSVNNEPNYRSEEAFKLHEGTKVQVLDSIKNWRKIKLDNGKIGWIASEDIKAL